MQDPVIWQKVEWRQGDGRYCFEVQQGGLHATLTAPHGGSLTVPTVAWYALLDALAASRKTTQRTERAFPGRAGARWGEAEINQLVDAFKSGKSVGILAKAHNRSVWAIETQLSQQGLWDRGLRMPLGQGGAEPAERGNHVARVPPSSGGRPWPDDDWESLAATAADRPAKPGLAAAQNPANATDAMPNGHNGNQISGEGATIHGPVEPNRLR